jgi:nickel/cobalt transporter (NicO) family protein
MRWVIAGAGFLVALALAGLWATGGFGVIASWAAESQRSFQNSMAATLRALKAGDPGALSALLAACLAYGVVHAAGPGHGKFLIGGYGMGSRVRMLPLAAISLAASLAQATAAVAFVYAGVLVFNWSRATMTTVADQWLEPVSYAMIATVGLYLVWRGVRHLRGAGGQHGEDHQGSGDHGHTHVHGPDCSHAHGPSGADMERLHGWRDAAALIASIAIRPCTGALFLLILTWKMGIGAAGVAGAYAMGLGTSAVTLAVAAASVTMREGAFAAVGRSRGLAVALPALELAAGGFVALVAGGMLIRSI